jgi:hypothetical protein
MGFEIPFIVIVVAAVSWSFWVERRLTRVEAKLDTILKKIDRLEGCRVKRV